MNLRGKLFGFAFCRFHLPDHAAYPVHPIIMSFPPKRQMRNSPIKIFLWLNHFAITDVNIFCWLYSSEKVNSHVIQDNLSFTIHFSLAILPKNLHGFSNSSTIDNPLYYLTVSIKCSKIRSGWENYPQLPISFMSSYRKVDC